ncbi:MAG: hypothetical protein K1X74_12995 [Pirellulales bacterium]|nr:hypothetical protein [Pirellulales bacterium]
MERMTAVPSTRPQRKPRLARRQYLTRRQGWLLALAAFALVGLEAVFKPLPLPHCPAPPPAIPEDGPTAPVQPEARPG